MNQNIKNNLFIRNLAILSDFVLLNALIYGYIRYDWAVLHHSNGINTYVIFLVGCISLAIAENFFSPIVHLRRSNTVSILRRVMSLSFVFILSSIVLFGLYSWYENVKSPDVLFSLLFWPLIYVVIIISRYFERWAIQRYRKMGHNTRHVLLIGSEVNTMMVYKTLMSDPCTGYVVDGYYDNKKLENAPEGLKYKGTINDFKNFMDSHNSENADMPNDIYCCLHSQQENDITTVMHYCNENVIHFYFVPVYINIFGRMQKSERLGDTIVFTNYDEPLANLTNRFIKRCFDVIFSLFVLICLLLIIPIVALIIKIQSPGPLFFAQDRTGHNGRTFKCYKFRSMHVNKDADLVQATNNDPRKYPFGNLMRKTSIDELPQFFNVLKGDMSIVGPRPHMLHHTEVYRGLIDKYMVRHFAKPGITGWAQVTGYRGETKELWQMEGRVKRDIWYIENWSVWLDIIIIFKTASQLIVRDKNAY